MANTIGTALRCCVLAGCALAALSETTFTEQSSSAWGSIDGGRTVDRGTHVSHSSGVLPDDLGLGERFGGGPRQPSVEPELGFRGGFGTGGRRQSTPQQPVPSAEGAPQQPVPGPVAGQGVPHQPFPSFGAAFPQQPFPNHGAAFPQQAFPSPAVGHNVPQQAFPSFSPAQPPVPSNASQQPGAGQGASQQPISGVNAINDAYRRLLGQYPNFNFHTGVRQPWPVYRQQQPGVGPRGSFGVGRQQPQPGSVAPAADGPGTDGTPPDTPTPGGAPAVGGTAFPPPGPQNPHPTFQAPDLSSLLNQLTSQAFQNLARGTFGAPRGGLTPVGGQVWPAAGGVAPQPGQPPVQSQHASVESVSLRSAQPAPGGAPTQSVQFHTIQTPSEHLRTLRSGLHRQYAVPFGFQAPQWQQQADPSAAWRHFQQPVGWPQRQ